MIAKAQPTDRRSMVWVYDGRRHGWVQLPEGITAFDKDPD